ncbi:MAG: two-component system VirA-like sensor kinase [Kiloniellaceae bacterium]
MTIAQTIGAAVSLFFLLTWLAVRGMTSSNDQSHALFREIDAFATAESGLHRDVLAARAGMLRSYDPLVEEIASMRAAIDRIARRLPAGFDRKGTLAPLHDIVNRKEVLTERFKSQNSLLQNSLTHFNLFSTKLNKPGRDAALIQEVSGLATAMLRFTLDTSPPAAEAVERKITELRIDNLPADEARTVEALTSHAKLLQEVLPQTDNILKSIVMQSSEFQQKKLAMLVRTHAAETEAAANLFRLLLYGTSVLLAVLLILLGIQLQGHARALRRRANIEHVIADFSTRALNSAGNHIASHVETALRDLAHCLLAERAYFIVPGESPRIFRWSRDGRFPPGWPLRALALPEAISPTPEGVLRASVPASGADTRVQAALVEAGVRHWLGTVSLQNPGPLLGFDILRSRNPFSPHSCGLFRMAFEAIASALERDLLEREKVRLETVIQRARRMETIGSLASGIAHNFNNIIGAILGHTEMAFAHAGPGSGLNDNLSEIRRAGERARDIVDQILTFGRRSDVKKEVVCLRAVIAETQAMLKATLPPDIQLRLSTTPEEVPVLGEPAQLQQVLLNLCNNAAQSMDRAGEIVISLQVKVLRSSKRVGQDELAPGRYLVVSVIDPGRGMSEATQARIFDPFFTTRHDGNGLGLATVREIVRQHDGSISVQSMPGAGTRVDTWLPALSSDRAATSSPRPLPQRNDTAETVLLIDSDPDHLLWHEEMVAALGYEPIGFADPDAALAACAAAPKRFDAALLCNGRKSAAVLDLASRLLQLAPQLPILVATTSVKAFSAPRLARAGVREVIHLPLESAELASALGRWSTDRPASV